MRALRVGITCHPTYGGSGAMATELARALAAGGHEVHLVAYAPPFRFESQPRLTLHELKVPDYPLFRYPPHDMAHASRLAQVILDADLDILHAHYAIPHSMSAWLGREIAGRREVGILTTLHGTDVTLVGNDPGFRPALRFALGQSDAITAVSTWLAERTSEFICSECVVDVIPNFVDTARFKPGVVPEVRRRFARDEEVLLAHASNFRPVKRVGDVVAAFAAVAKQRPARLLLIGDGPERAAAEASLEAYGIKPLATFAGEVPDPAELMACPDVFLLPSDGESFGLAALEAMACGVPVVGTNAGGFPELVHAGAAGEMVPVARPDLLAQTVLRLLSDSAHREALRAEALRCVREEFSTGVVVPRYEALYRSVISKRESQRAAISPSGSGPAMP